MACALVCGDVLGLKGFEKKYKSFHYCNTIQAYAGFFGCDGVGYKRIKVYLCIFSRDIPHIIEDWLKPNVSEFLNSNQLGAVRY